MPSIRKAIFSSLLVASPKLMEPIYEVEALCQNNRSASAVYKIVQNRRGYVQYNQPIATTPLYVVKAYVPLIDSYGLETDIRSSTHGQVYVSSTFSSYQMLSADPFLKNQTKDDLLVREFLLKLGNQKVYIQ